jgi:hypothetical protein
MRYYVPALAPGWINTPSLSNPGDHFGGTPWGLPAERWPHCGECKRPLTFVAQLEHDGVRLDLGREGRVMFIFMCVAEPGMCEVWEPDSGATHVLVLEPEHRTHELTLAQQAGALPYLTVQGWKERDDGVAPYDYDVFFHDERYLEQNLDEYDVDSGTKLGGAPFWPQAVPACEWDPEWPLVLQLAGTDWLPGPVPSPAELGCAVQYQLTGKPFVSHEAPVRHPHAPRDGVVVTDDGSWGIERFGDFKMYVCVRRGRVPEGRMHMQR